jgi:hypothetical protein
VGSLLVRRRLFASRSNWPLLLERRRLHDALQQDGKPPVLLIELADDLVDRRLVEVF